MSDTTLPGMRQAVPVKMLLWALGVFTLCFLLFHGREAALSGSWDYILTHDDDYLYVSIANGFAQDPKSDANPFYHEERGRTNSPLDYAAVALVGTLAAALDVPVPWFMPFWKILIPLLLWYTLSFCLARFWGLGAPWNGALSVLLLLAMDLCHGPSQFGLMRFAHPGDGMWLAFLWVSMVLRVDCVGRLYPWLLTGIAVAVIVICPYYVIIGGWLLFFMTSWSVWTGKMATARRHLTPLLLIGGLCLARVVQVVLDVESSRYLQHALNLEIESSGVLDVSALVLFLVAVLAVGFACRWRRSDLTIMDAALLGILALEPLAANTQFFLGNDHQISLHRYYHLVLELACIVGWSARRLPALLARTRGSLWDWLLPVSLLAAEGIVLAHPDLNWFRYLPRTDPTHFMTDNDTLILGVLPLLLLCVWLPLRLPRGVQWVRPGRALVVISLAAMALYAVKPSQLTAQNTNIPFSGAYDWLAHNCTPGSVVLTMPGKWTHIDYSLLYAPVKAYTNFVGNHLSDEADVELYRASYYVALREGLLPGASYLDLEGARDLSRHLRLDYVLVDREGPFLERIISQLGDFAEEVYADERCVLLRISA